MTQDKDQFPYILTYTKRYVPGSSDLKIIGEDVISIEFKDGKHIMVASLMKEKDKEKMEQFGIRVETESKRDEYKVEICKKKIVLTDPEALPFSIRWVDQDLFTSKGFGTTGTLESFLTSIKLNASGGIEMETKKI